MHMRTNWARPLRAGLTAVTLVASTLAVTAVPAHAATFTVTNCTDSGPGSLRQALINAEATEDHDTIEFAVTCPAAEPIKLTSGVLSITKDVTINGPGATLLAVDGQGGSGVFLIAGNATDVVISGLTIQGGRSDRGAGIFSVSFQGTLSVVNSTLAGNTVECTATVESCGANGGAIYAANGSALTVTNSTLSGNTATCSASGAGLSCGAEGGAIFDGATVIVTNSTLSGNSAVCTADAPASCTARGGGINNNELPLTVTNSTLSGNTAACTGSGCGDVWGGGIYINIGGVTITASTLADNSAGVGGNIFANVATVTLTQTIVAGGTPTHCSGNNPFVDGGSNLDFPDSACPGIDADPHLQALADNGGATQTRALGSLSAALDSAASCSVTIDQRYVPRPQGTACDIGAYEPASEDALLTLGPPTGTNPVGTQHTLSADVTVGGVPVPNWIVTFVISGPNAAASGTAATNDAGTASFTYTGTGVGTDTIIAVANNARGGTAETGPVEKIWVQPPSGGGGGGDGGDDDDDDGDRPGRGRITVIEDVGNDGVDALGGVRRGRVSFGFHTKELKRKTFRLDDGRKRVFRELRSGTYTVAQDKKDGWKLDKIVCKDPTRNTKIVLKTRRARIKLKAGEHVVCTFTNSRK